MSTTLVTHIETMTTHSRFGLQPTKKIGNGVQLTLCTSIRLHRHRQYTHTITMSAAPFTPKSSQPSPEDVSSGFSRSWLLMTNATMMIAWARTLRVLYRNFDSLSSVDGSSDNVCLGTLSDYTKLALIISFFEVTNAGMGFTRSKAHFVLLFAVIRIGVELLVAPLSACNSWQHMLTVFCWSLGDTVRFGCFVLDQLVPGGTLAKSVRYTIGPLLFPFGAAGEMLMVVAAAADGRPLLYLAAVLWPAGFYPLWKQLLRQRRKHFSKQAQKKEKEIKSV